MLALRMKLILIISMLALISCSFACQNEVKAGTSAPGFSLPDLSGNEVSLKQFRGRVVLLDFWATWCGPCRISIPELINLQEKYRDKGLVIIGVSIDDKRHASDEYLRSFKEQLDINYIVLRADGKTVRNYLGSGQFAIPTMFIIDRQGNVSNIIVGLRPDAVEESVVRILE